MPDMPVYRQTDEPNYAVRRLWILLIGSWLGGLCLIAGYLLCLTVIKLPAGLVLLNRIPSIMTLRPLTPATYSMDADGIGSPKAERRTAQVPFLLRALYFVLVGWWFTALWLTLAWIFIYVWSLLRGKSLAPAFMLFDHVPTVLTLQRR